MRGHRSRFVGRMLVKLGVVWVDPSKVDAIEGEFVFVSGRALDSRCPDIDTLADIVNSALVVQSYGGEIPDAVPKEA